MKKNKLISVVIPVYNSQSTLVKCINSVLNQTYNNYEVILVDNNSTDSSAIIIKNFQSKNKKIKYVLETKRGRGAARNCGIMHSLGEIIAMTDSDCVVPKDWLEKLTKLIREKKEKIVMGSEKDIIGNYWTKNIQRVNSEILNQNKYGKYINHLDTKNFALKTNIAKKIQFNCNLKAYEDYDFFLRIKDKYKIRYIPNIKVGHFHKVSMCGAIKTNFERAYWFVKIQDRDDVNIKKNSFLELFRYLFFPVWLFLQMFRNPFNYVFFLFIWHSSWGIGVLCSKLSNGAKNGN